MKKLSECLMKKLSYTCGMRKSIITLTSLFNINAGLNHDSSITTH